MPKSVTFSLDFCQLIYKISQKRRFHKGLAFHFLLVCEKIRPKLLQLPIRTNLMDRHMRMTLQRFLQMRLHIAAKPHDPTKEFEVEFFFAADRDIGSGTASETNGARKGAHQGDDGRNLEIEDGVRVRQSIVQLTTIVAVDDPLRLGEPFAMGVFHGFQWRFHPTGKPKDGVQMKHGQMQLIGQSSRQRAFPAAGVADDDDPLQLLTLLGRPSR